MGLLLYLLVLWVLSCNQQYKPSAKPDLNQTIIPMHNTLSIGDTMTSLEKSIGIIYQATNGHYWFGGIADGLYRYDGQYIIQYTSEDGLCHHSIREIKEDKEGNIYLSTQHGGICKFDGHQFTTLPVRKSHTPEKDWKLQPGDLWFKGETGKNGPYRYDGETLYALEFPHHYLADAFYANFPDKPWSPYEVYFIYTDRIGNIWFGTSNFGVCRYDGTTLSWMYEDHLTNIEGGGSFGIRSILEDIEGKFWFCNTQYRYSVAPDPYENDNGVHMIEYKRELGIEGLKTTIGNEMVYFMSAVEDDGTMWLATYNEGVYKYNGKSIEHYPVMDGSKVINLYSIYKDRRGDLWLGTLEAGLYKFNGEAFEKFKL